MLKELTEYGNKVKKTKEEMKFILSEIKKNLHGTNNGRDETEYQISNLEYKKAKNTQSEQPVLRADLVGRIEFLIRFIRKKRIQKNEDSIRSLWDNFRHTHIHIMGVLEGKERARN